jgi:uncharacterized membrane protein YvlD (DUF360 family)
MTTFLLHLAVLSLTVFGLSRWLPSFFHIRRASTAVVVAVVFSVLNFLLGTFLSCTFHLLLAVPGFFSFGLVFLFIPFFVNTVLLWITDKALASFEVTTVRALLMSAAVITLVNAVFHSPFCHR